MEEFWSKELVDQVQEGEHDSDDIRVYVAGPVYDYASSDRVRQSIKERCERYEKIEAVDPLEKHPEDREQIPPTDVDTLSSCDVVLVYHVPQTESWGTPAEVYLAAMAGYPVFVWGVGDKLPPLSVWLESAMVGRYKKLNNALSAILRQGP